MADVKSLSAKELTAAARSSAAKALDRHKALARAPLTVGFVPPYWWIGLILREEAELEKIADAGKAAADIHAGIAAAMPSMKGGTPGAIFQGGHIILGFLPPKEIGVIAE
jgi:hypothetical protein